MTRQGKRANRDLALALADTGPAQVHVLPCRNFDCFVKYLHFCNREKEKKPPLSSSPDAFLDGLELAKDLGDLRHRRDTFHILDGRREFGRHLRVQEVASRGLDKRRHLEVCQRQLVSDEVFLAALDCRLHLAQRALKLAGRGIVHARVKGLDAEHHLERRSRVSPDLAIVEERPLGDLGFGLEVRSEKLRRLGARTRNVGGDGRALGQAETVGALKGWHFAERELGEKVFRPVGYAHRKLGRLQLEAVQRGNSLSLSRGPVVSLI